MSLSNNLSQHLQSVLDCPIESSSRLSGGDISDAFFLSCPAGNFFLKINTDPNATAMFLTEALGLKRMASIGAIKTPEVITHGKIEHEAFLLMEFVKAKRPEDQDFARLGHQLAALHKSTSDLYGLDFDNFIGSLDQSNTNHRSWSEFYVGQRLLPQLKLAVQRGGLDINEIPSESRMLNVMDKETAQVEAGFLHGDLWSGNYLIGEDGTPYLIDPAIYYGHNEVDIAMTRLFGGFEPAFYSSYRELIPKPDNEQTLHELYQLYYLLVHLNLFGRSYYRSVHNILLRYF